MMTELGETTEASIMRYQVEPADTGMPQHKHRLNDTGVSTAMNCTFRLMEYCCNLLNHPFMCPVHVTDLSQENSLFCRSENRGWITSLSISPNYSLPRPFIAGNLLRFPKLCIE